MAISFNICIDKNIIQIYNDKDIKFFNKNFVDLSLKVCQYIYQSKKYYPILKVAIPNLKNCLQYVFFANSHLVVCTSKVELDKLSSPA